MNRSLPGGADKDGGAPPCLPPECDIMAGGMSSGGSTDIEHGDDFICYREMQKS